MIIATRPRVVINLTGHSFSFLTFATPPLEVCTIIWRTHRIKTYVEEGPTYAALRTIQSSQNDPHAAHAVQKKVLFISQLE